MLDPDSFLRFVYLDEFLDDWRELYGNDPDGLALWPLEHLIMSNPLSGESSKEPVDSGSCVLDPTWLESAKPTESATHIFRDITWY